MIYTTILDKVLIEPSEPINLTQHGLWVSTELNKNSGKVIAIANKDLAHIVGKTVHYRSYLDSTLKLCDKEYLVISENDILIVED